MTPTRRHTTQQQVYTVSGDKNRPKPRLFAPSGDISFRSGLTTYL